MILVEVVLLPEVLLDSPDLAPHVGLLLLAAASFSLELAHHAPELVLHGSMEGPDALLFLEQLVPHKRIHGVVFGLILHLFAHLLLGHDSFPQVEIFRAPPSTD
jgi:hypothetical protein